MKKYLEYRDDKSNKFWEITIIGNSYTVRYGKIGTVGQSKTKEFSTEDEALKDAEKLAESKIKKGYVEVDSNSFSKMKIQEISISKRLGNYITKKLDQIKKKDIQKSLKTVNWNNMLNKAIDETTTYWKTRLTNDDDLVFGTCDVRWEDTDNRSIQFDLDTVNDPEEAFCEGCWNNEDVILYNDFYDRYKLNDWINDNETHVEFCETLKKILMIITLEAIQYSLSDNSFSSSPKLSPFYILFSDYHDADFIVVFDTSKDLGPVWWDSYIFNPEA